MGCISVELYVPLFGGQVMQRLSGGTDYDHVLGGAEAREEVVVWFCGGLYGSPCEAPLIVVLKIGLNRKRSHGSNGQRQSTHPLLRCANPIWQGNQRRDPSIKEREGSVIIHQIRVGVLSLT